MCKVSEGVYKKHLENRFGIVVCKGKLKDQEIHDILDDIKLLDYLNKNNSCSCNKEKLIETLT